MVNCAKILVMLHDFVEQSLPVADMEAIKTHLEGCALCQHLAKTYESTRQLCRNAMKQQAPAELGQRLMDFLRDKTRS